MNKGVKWIFLAGFVVSLAGCDIFDDEDNNPTGTPNPDDPSTPVAETYNVTVESVDMINVDSGQPISVEGFPLQGGTLTVE